MSYAVCLLHVFCPHSGPIKHLRWICARCYATVEKTKAKLQTHRKRIQRTFRVLDTDIYVKVRDDWRNYRKCLDAKRKKTHKGEKIISKEYQKPVGSVSDAWVRAANHGGDCLLHDGVIRPSACVLPGNADLFWHWLNVWKFHQSWPRPKLVQAEKSDFFDGRACYAAF